MFEKENDLKALYAETNEDWHGTLDRRFFLSLIHICNEDGEFRFKKVPAGKYTLRVQLLGYETQEKKVTVSNDFTVDVHFLMSDESIMTDEVVVSANRNETSRKVAPVVVNVMNARLFESVNSTDLAKSLNYQSGLRVENNCQNCGFPQVRINGLEGPYSQILINSRPVVSALSGVCLLYTSRCV